MNYWDYYLEPVKYTDDCYHIGSKNAPCWLVKSSDGLILIDTGLPQTLYQILLNVDLLGLNYRDVKHIIHSHGHIDHIGGTRALVALTGAKTYIGAGDADTVTGKNRLQWTNEFNRPFEEPFEPDCILRDGDQITIGDKEFRFYETPGHTRGTLTFFFNVNDKGKKYTAGMFGGGGLKSMSKEYLEKYGLPFSLRQSFLDGIDRMFDMVPDVHLGNHLGDNKHFEKLEKLKSGAAQESEINPFIDGSSWKWFLSKRRAEAVEFFENDK